MRCSTHLVLIHFTYLIFCVYLSRASYFPQPPAAILVFDFMHLTILDTSDKGNDAVFVFRVQLISHSILSSRSVHTVTHCRNSFFLQAEQYFYVHHVFTIFDVQEEIGLVYQKQFHGPAAHHFITQEDLKGDPQIGSTQDHQPQQKVQATALFTFHSCCRLTSVYPYSPDLAALLTLATVSLLRVSLQVHSSSLHWPDRFGPVGLCFQGPRVRIYTFIPNTKILCQV